MSAATRSSPWLKLLGWLWFGVFSFVAGDAMVTGVITTHGRGGPHTFYGPNAALVGAALLVVACWPGIFLLKLGERRARLVTAASAFVVLMLIIAARFT
jgi:hypothetical protein